MSHAHTYAIKHTEFQCITSQRLCITSQGLCITSQGLCIISQGYIPGIMQHIPRIRVLCISSKGSCSKSQKVCITFQRLCSKSQGLCITSQRFKHYIPWIMHIAQIFVVLLYWQYHILQDYFTGTGAISRLPKCQRSKLEGYVYINHHPGNDENQQQNKPQQNCAHVSWHKLFSLTPFTKLSFYWQSN